MHRPRKYLFSLAAEKVHRNTANKNYGMNGGGGRGGRGGGGVGRKTSTKTAVGFTAPRSFVFDHGDHGALDERARACAPIAPAVARYIVTRFPNRKNLLRGTRVNLAALGIVKLLHANRESPPPLSTTADLLLDFRRSFVISTEVCASQLYTCPKFSYRALHELNLETTRVFSLTAAHGA